MNEGEKLLHDATVRGLLHLGEIGALRQVLEAGLQTSMSNLARQQEAILNHLFQDRDTRRWLGLSSTTPATALAAEMGAKHATDAAARARMAVAASELVFSHSLTDQVASDCCRAITLLAPKRCEAEVEAKQVELRAVRDLGFDGLVTKALAKHIAGMSRQSLPNRIDWLHRMCPPTSPIEGLPAYTYDRERTVRLDERRHDVVHESGIRAARDVSDDDITYLQQTAVYLPRVVMVSLGVHLDTNYTAGRWRTLQA